MSQLGLTALANDITSRIYTNKFRLIQGNTVRDRLINIKDSFLNITDHANVNGGYLGVASGRVNTALINAASQSGKFLRDDGTWATAAGTVYTGTTNRISVSGSTINIDAAYVGQTSITTLGTVTTGTLGSGAKILVGSDATGDIWFNGGSGAISRSANINFDGNILKVITATFAKVALSDWLGNPAIYLLDPSVALSNSNFGIAGDGNNTYINAPSNEIRLKIAGTTYVTFNSSGGSVAGTMVFNEPYTAQTANYIVMASDHTIDCTANTFTVTLPTAVGITGKVYEIKNSGAGTITLAANGAETIDGFGTKVMNTQYACYRVQSNGTNWIVLSFI